VYFVTQNPLDVPDTVLGQLGNRVQHALRAFTPRDQKAVRSAASTLRPNPAFNAESAITELGVGEALVSFLDEKGRPGMVERALVVPPASRIGPVDDAERQALIAGSVVAGVYEQAIDRESAFERLRAGAAGKAGAGTGAGTGTSTGAGGRPPGAPAPAPAPAEGSITDTLRDVLGGLAGGGSGGGARRGDSVIEAAAKSAARSIGSTLGREIIRGVLGSLLGGGGSRRR